MQIELIETFLDLCQTHSFNQTAERLGVTQSTISSRVKALEKLFDRRLFQRNRAGTALTTEGLRFEAHARALQLRWSEAKLAVRDVSSAAMNLRVGIQHDLAASRLNAWFAEFRALLPESRFYIEADFSEQMCTDVMSGQVDIALLYSPKPHPDLHFESIGEVSYRMISNEITSLDGIQTERYILGNYSPAFFQAHAALHPGLHGALISSGQNDTVAALLTSLNGTAYVLDRTAAELIATKAFQPVHGATTIQQTVYVAVHLRNRHRATYRRLTERLRDSFPPASRIGRSRAPTSGGGASA
jgi:DNA-binding transcriptional LysR family regulator